MIRVSRKLADTFMYVDLLKEARLENQITSFPIKETLRKIPSPLLIKRPLLRTGCGIVRSIAVTFVLRVFLQRTIKGQESIDFYKN